MDEQSTNDSGENDSSKNDSSQNDSSKNDSSQNDSSKNDSSQNDSSQNAPVQNAPVQSAPSHNYKALATLSKVVQGFIGTVILVLAASAAGVVAVDLLASSGQVEIAKNVIPVLYGLDILQPCVYVTSGVILMVWLRRAFRNLSALNVSGTFNKEWHVWSFVIPILNLYVPLSVVNEIWRASDPAELDSVAWKQSKGSRLVAAWWTCFLVYAVLNGVRNYLTRVSSTAGVAVLLSSPTAFVVLQAIFIAAGVLLILIVQDITARQEKKFELVNPKPDQ